MKHNPDNQDGFGSLSQDNVIPCIVWPLLVLSVIIRLFHYDRVSSKQHAIEHLCEYCRNMFSILMF